MYLEELLPNDAYSEVSKELIYKAHYNQVRKIIEAGEYDFTFSKEIDFDKLRKQTQINDPHFLTNNFPKGYQSLQTLGSFLLTPKHKVDTYLLKKELNKGKHSNKTLDPIYESKFPCNQSEDKRMTTSHSQNRLTPISTYIDLSSEPIHERLYLQNPKNPSLTPSQRLGEREKPSLLAITGENPTLLELQKLKEQKEIEKIEQREKRKQALVFVNRIKREKGKGYRVIL